MKISTKAISSPGRTEKFPPPLMRFLRSNVGSKSSRGRRSRASPMFIRKKNTVIEATLEPSSPKVTCIGQVRVRRSKKKNAAAGTTARCRNSSNRHCWLLRKLKPRSFRRVWRKWVSFFRCGYCEKSELLRHSPEVEANRGTEYRSDAGESDERKKIEDLAVEADNEVLISRSPPKNAFLLTRCRSAPYRSSSLASKFFESTMEKTGEEEDDDDDDDDDDETGENKFAKKLSKLSIEKDEGINDNFVKQNGVDEDSIDGSCNGVEELKTGPLILTRCKSEPARTGDKIFMSLSS